MNIHLKQISAVFLLLATFHASHAFNKAIAVTIDDLPFVGEYRNFHLKMIIDTLEEQQVPATGFIIANEVRQDNWKLLTAFRQAGLGLGNHTSTHMNLNQVKTQEYIKEIDDADARLSKVLTRPKYFRYPYLAMGKGIKRNKVLCHLSQMHYRIAPITIDSRDYYFNQRLLSVPEKGRRQYLESMKSFYLEFIEQQTLQAEAYNQYHKKPDTPQILLIHANLLNAYVLPDIIRQYRAEGYTFVSLKKALKPFKEVAMYCPKKAPPTPTLRIPEPFVSAKQDHKIEQFMQWD
jgi:peptidoglycan-N-acetylglucosamine deacetylase